MPPASMDFEDASSSAADLAEAEPVLNQDDDDENEEVVMAEALESQEEEEELSATRSSSRKRGTQSSNENDDDDGEEEEEQEEFDEEEEEETPKKKRKTSETAAVQEKENNGRKGKRKAGGGRPLSDQSASPGINAALKSHRNVNEKGKPPEAGIIQKIYVENFMCHKKMSTDLCRNVNFIYGQNGSGKVRQVRFCRKSE